MQKSDRFIDLETELLRLKEQFLPEISPTSSYSEREIALTIAYIVLTHSEIEAYFEDRVWEIALHSKNKWVSERLASRTLITLLAFSGQKMELPPDTLTPTQGTTIISPNKIKIDKKIEFALNAFYRVIDQNHGLKEANLLALLLPIGIDSDDLDSVMLATMNTFGEQRGLIAHKSATSYRATQLPDPANELTKIQQITVEILKLDNLTSNLMQNT
jgi:hypothetical protein